jgi:hypothetical protein
MVIPRLAVGHLAAALLLAIGCDKRSPAISSAERDPGASYITVGLGDEKVFNRTIRSNGRASKEVVTELVVAVERTDGFLVTVEYRYDADSKPRWTFRFRAAPDGIYWIAKDGQTFETPECILKLPVRAGAVWEGPSGGQPESTIQYTAGPEEEIEVPAGKFRAVRIDSVFKGNGLTLKLSDWYDSKVGLVKSNSQWDDGEDETKVLTSFTPRRK